MYRDRDKLLELVRGIYRDPGSRTQWNRILGELQKLLRLHNLTVIEIDVPSGMSRTILHHDVLDEYLRLYEQHYARLDPADRGRFILPLQKGAVAASCEFDSFDEFRRTPLFLDFFEPQGSHFFLAAMLDIGPLEGHMLSAQRTRKTGSYTPEDKRCMEILTPHLSNRIALEKRFERSGRVHTALEAALEAQQTACMLLDGEMRVVFANPQAESVLRAADGLFLDRERRLAAPRDEATAALREALARARAICSADGHEDPGLVRIERPSGKPAYVLLARPCPLGGLWTHDPAGVLVIINDPAAIQTNLESTLARAFGLTSTEAAVATLLLAGATAGRIAASRGVSLPTVRSQIRGLLEKTGTTSQVAFVSLVFRTLGSILD